MQKKKLKKWIEILKDKNSLNVVFLYLNKYGGFKFVIDDDLLSTIGEDAAKKLLEIYHEGFGKSIKEAFKPFDELHLNVIKKIVEKTKPPWFGKGGNCSNACTFIDDCWNCCHITEEEKEKYKDGD